MVDRTEGGKIVLKRRIRAKGLKKLIAHFHWKNRRFKDFCGLCSIVITSSANAVL